MPVVAPPFVLVALAPFSPLAEPFVGEPVVAADRQGLAEALAAMAPVFGLDMPRERCPSGFLSVPVASLADFRPERVAVNCDYARRLGEAAAFVSGAVGSGLSASGLADAWAASFADLPAPPPAAPAPATPGASGPASGASGRGGLDDLLAMVAMPEGATARPPAGGAAATLAALGDLSAEVQNRVFADPVFRAAEAAWRGADYVLSRAAGADPGLSLGLVPATAATVSDSLGAMVLRLAETPPQCLLADMALDAAPARMEIWEALARAAESLLCPAMAEAGPGFFLLDDWKRLDSLPHLVRHLDGPAHAKWRRFTATSGAGWVLAGVNPFLLRPPYGPGSPSRVAGLAEARPPWVGPVWGLAASLAKNLADGGWPTPLAGRPGADLTDLGLAAVSGGSGTSPVAARITEDRAIEFAGSGFSALCGLAGRDAARLPFLTMVDGAPAAFRFFLGRVLGVLFWCKTALEHDPSADPSPLLTAALREFFGRAGLEAPADLSIAADGAPRDGHWPLAVALTPPPALMPRAGQVSLRIVW